MNGELLNLMQSEIDSVEKMLDSVNSEIKSKQEEALKLRNEINLMRKGKSIFSGEKVAKKIKKKKIEKKENNP